MSAPAAAASPAPSSRRREQPPRRPAAESRASFCPHAGGVAFFPLVSTEGRALMTPAIASFRLVAKLERKLQSQLHGSRGLRRPACTAKSSRTRIHIRCSELDQIERIEHLPTQLQFRSLAHADGLQEREIPIVDWTAAHMRVGVRGGAQGPGGLYAV